MTHELWRAQRQMYEYLDSVKLPTWSRSTAARKDAVKIMQIGAAKKRGGVSTKGTR